MVTNVQREENETVKSSTFNQIKLFVFVKLFDHLDQQLQFKMTRFVILEKKVLNNESDSLHHLVA